ncbi:MAG: type II secretion system F family protein [Aquificae bacterium]|nr:type II secretion system F family protein [Aquificota bacterium]
MPFYKYRAVDAGGKEVTGIKEVAGPSALKKILKQQGLVVYEIEEISAPEKSPGRNIKLSLFSTKISQQELALLLYEIGLLLARGVHITQIFEILSRQTENPTLQKALLSVKSSLQEGSSVAQALKKTGIFPDFLIEMVRAGEESGALDKIFLSASEYIESQNEFRSKVVNSLIYPTIVIVIGFIAMLVIMNFVVPTITKIYSQFDRELPTSTRMVIYFSQISGYFLKVLPFIAIGLFILRKRIITKEKVDILKLKIPFFKKVHLYTQYSNWSNTLALLLSGGLTLDRSLEIANKTITNTVLRKKFDILIEKVREGKPLSQELKKEQLIPDNAIQLITIGEETGQLDEMLKLISQIYRKQTERLISIFLSYLEPVTLIILSVLIGFFVFATLLPIFNLNVR